MTLRNVLNKIRWDSNSDVSSYQITYIHRGDVGDKRTILFSDLLEIHSSWFLCRDSSFGEIMIPFHRVVEVRNQKSDEIIWRKRAKQR